MKISLVSDTHLEFGPLELPGGEILILAGDICEYRTFKKQQSFVVDFFNQQCSKYEQVFMVLGNHESYKHRLDTTYDDLKALLPSNVTLLENQAVEYRGVVFMGATLWTDFNRGDPVTIEVARAGMNDFRAIQNYYKDTGNYHKLSPEFIYRTHKDTIEYFNTQLPYYKNSKVVVITHHAPTQLSIHEKYRHDHHMNGSFASDLSELILDNPQIVYWVHGHCHDPVNYEIGTTRVVSNPRGYVGHEDTSQFNPAFYFEIHEHHS
jgi:Icc-related predicted phosphoesterase